MNKVSKVLCVIDPTTKEQPALARATWLANSTGAELVLLICYYVEYLSVGRFFDSQSRIQAREKIVADFEKYLEKLARPRREQGLKVSTAAIWDHPLHEGIVRYAASHEIDLVVKDTHYHSAVNRTLLSNTDWQLIRTLAPPLWLVKPLELAENPVFIAAIDPMNENDKPAALDDAIMNAAKSYAAACAGEVHAFHAYDPRIAVATAANNAYLPVSLPLGEIEAEMREQHGKRFAEMVEYHDIPSERAHLLSGRTHEELPTLATTLNAGVVVMGAVARNRMKRLFVGATAEPTLDHLPCDLLIVKPDWFETPADVLEGDEDAA